MHAVIDRHPKHGIHFRVLAKCLRLSGGDDSAPAPWSASWKVIVRPPSATSTSCANPSCRKIAAATSSIRTGFHAWRVRRCLRRYPRVAHAALVTSSATTPFCSSVVVPTIPWGSAAGAATVALEACVKARNAGRHLEKESRDILTEAAKHSPELAIALEMEGDQVRVRHRRQARRSELIDPSAG